MVVAVHSLGRAARQAYAQRRSGGSGFSVPGYPADMAPVGVFRPYAGGGAQGTGAQGLLGLQETRGAAGAGGAGAYARTDNACGVVASGYGRFVGRSAGSGQCVALVQAAAQDLGPTRGWAPGAAVQAGGGSLQPGTVIATFDRSGRYANATDGSSHAAIYLGQNAQGIQVMDQWVGHAASSRTIPWSNPGGAPVDVAGNYRVVVRQA